MKIKALLLSALFAIVSSLSYAAVNDNEEIMIEPIGGTGIGRFVEPQAVYFNQTINLVYANPEQATVSVYTEQGILIDLTTVSAFGQVDIDTSGWSSGTYYIYVQSASASYQAIFDYVPVNERA
ncbi:MAG: T9SS type A sorting domain-containing protein [Muribaculaceae bacterium]|nr:T9SS type A sorting domain-containing protein [Muribaculaceae bacterium]